MPSWAPFTVLSSNSSALSRMYGANPGLDSAVPASCGASRNRAAASIMPEPQDTTLDSAMTLPARAGSVWRNSATNLEAAVPMPNPASAPNIPIVLCMMPSCPYVAFPSMRATSTAESRANTREANEPPSDHSDPWIRRTASGEAVYRPRSPWTDRGRTLT